MLLIFYCPNSLHFWGSNFYHSAGNSQPKKYLSADAKTQINLLAFCVISQKKITMLVQCDFCFLIKLYIRENWKAKSKSHRNDTTKFTTKIKSIFYIFMRNILMIEFYSLRAKNLLTLRSVKFHLIARIRQLAIIIIL